MRGAIPVFSSKGGVGKTVVACNLALRLSENYKVGLIDADIDSSNLLEELGIEDREHDMDDDRNFIPIKYKGIEIFSMAGILEDPSHSVSKSGQEVRRILQDAVLETQWSEDIDFFVIDMPPSFGDTWKVMQKLFGDTILGGVLVSIPSAIRDAERAYDLCKRERVRLLGVIENFGRVSCPNCGTTYWPFGRGKTEEFAEERNIEYFGSLPIRHNRDKLLDFGEPIDNMVEKIEEVSESGTEGEG